MFSRLIFIAFVCLQLLQTVSSTQFSLDPCCQTSDCAEGRQCILLDIENGLSLRECAPGEKDCFCSEKDGLVPCVVDLECRIGDVCDNGAQGGTCVSKCFLAADGRRELDEDEKPMCDDQPTFPRVCPRNGSMGSESPRIPDENVQPTPSPTSQPIPTPQPTPTLQPTPTPQPMPTSQPMPSLQLPQTVSSTQFSLDPCCQTSDCAEGRQCILFDDENESSVRECAPGEKDCFCSEGFPLVSCAVNQECRIGDVCDNGAQGGTCVSKCFLAADGLRELDEDEKPMCDDQPTFPKVCPRNGSMGSESPQMQDENVQPTPSPISQPMPNLVVEPSPDEEPSASEEAEGPESTPFDIFGPMIARPSPEVEEMPQIVVTTPTPVSVAEILPTPVAPQTTPTPEVEETPEPTTAVCVAVEELEGVQKVFEQDYHAWVLCDSTGSCATPGHMVMWNGDGMMMKSYCDIVGCERKVMAVNSPRWSAGAIRAKTEGLAYTSFAARWESKAEERVLAAVVRVAV